MINYRIIARIFSQVLILEGLFMLLSGGVSWVYGEHEARSFLYSALITIVTGVLVFTPLRNEERVYGIREGFIINTGIWIIFSFFGTLPFVFSGVTETFSDAFFESMSGFTTTGATIFSNVESLPHGILFWRSLTQWLGGIAAIALSLYVLPVIKALNIPLSTSEFSGSRNDRIHPKVIETTKRLIFIFTVLTFAEFIFLVIGKMPVFDAICHSLSTLSTGGFSTKNNGIGSFSSPYINAVVLVFMFLAGTNLTLIYFAIKKNFKKIISSQEFVFYVLLVLIFSAAVTLLLHFGSGVPILRSLSQGCFHVVSIITTTGYYTVNYSLWSNLLILLMFIIMFTGGMTGSASGGVKTVRLLIITRNSRNENRRLIHPNAYLPVRVDNKTVPQTIVYNLLIFIALYFMVLCAGAVGVSLMHKDVVTSFSTAASMLGNIGPGIGDFGPYNTYAALPGIGKWFLSGLMLAGRLELLAVLILFTRGFYK
jgi:trk system potassium uptake protein TrkH